MVCGVSVVETTCGMQSQRTRSVRNGLKFLFVKAQELSLDEGYIKSKPLKWGIKSSVTCEIYTAQIDAPDTVGDLGITADPLIRLTKHSHEQCYSLYTDRVSTSIDLADRLLRPTVPLCGTRVANRNRFTKSLVRKRVDRGASEMSCDGEVAAAVWCDKSLCVLSPPATWLHRTRPPSAAIQHNTRESMLLARQLWHAHGMYRQKRPADQTVWMQASPTLAWSSSLSGPCSVPMWSTIASVLMPRKGVENSPSIASLRTPPCRRPSSTPSRACCMCVVCSAQRISARHVTSPSSLALTVRLDLSQRCATLEIKRTCVHCTTYTFWRCDIFVTDSIRLPFCVMISCI